MSAITPIHPFPARMAPEIALQELGALPLGSVVLDPMVGSGTTLRIASEHGHRGMGFDLDPLAVLMASVWTTPLNLRQLVSAGAEVHRRANEFRDDVILTWMDEDEETRSFVSFWFAPAQQAQLRRLAKALYEFDADVIIKDALRIALSRLIITKDSGASMARDVSHSRPHRRKTPNDFDVLKEFERSVRILAGRLERQMPLGGVQVRSGDARALVQVAPTSVDAIITSPPYLNAIDYMRGHKLSLVWLGYTLSELRRIRSKSIGAERRPDLGDHAQLCHAVREEMPAVEALDPKHRHMLDRYIADIYGMTSELQRVLRPGGRAVLVVGDSTLRGVFVENSKVVATTARWHGLVLDHVRERVIPPSRRYLPPPASGDTNALHLRMRTENVMIFIKPFTATNADGGCAAN